MPWTNSRKYCIWGISTRFNSDGVFKKKIMSTLSLPIRYKTYQSWYKVEMVCPLMSQ